MQENHASSLRGLAQVITASFVFAFAAMNPSAYAQAGNYHVIYKFTGTSSSGFTPDSSGNFYGVDQSGKYGTVYELTPSGGGWKRNVIFAFPGGAGGYSPSGALIFDPSGNLYGTTASGGTYGGGTVYELSPSSSGGWTQEILYAFTGGSDGATPEQGVIFDSAGNLYGTTFEGGIESGVVFELSPPVSGTAWNQTVLHTFNYSTDGAYPNGGLAFDSTGNLYGTASSGGDTSCGVGAVGDGCGVVFEFTPSSSGWNYNVIFTFNGTDGASPIGQLTFDSSGNLYGVTAVGGVISKCYSDGCGVVYKLSLISGVWNETLLHVFQPGTGNDAYGPGGGTPQGGISFDGPGTLYGVAAYGGANGYGVVYKLLRESSGAWKEAVVYNFAGGAEGYTPLEPLTLTTAGDLLGTTYQGGNSGCHGLSCGVLYEIKP
jgi:uncharacterized repeat protein (TIGR03803 family)